MSYEFDLEILSDVGSTADTEYTILSTDSKPLQFIPITRNIFCKSVKQTSNTLLKTHSADVYLQTDISYTKQPCSLSTFKPPIDIVLLGAAPLKIQDIPIQSIVSGSLEYLQSSVPDLHSIYWETVWKQITTSHREVRCANFRATKKAIANIMHNGGCKILQFMAHCCNPKEIHSLAQHPYKHLINPYIMHSDQDYVLLECQHNVIDGEWLSIHELKPLLNADYNDIVIVLSPQYHKLVDIFAILGYKYIIGIKTFNQNITKQNRDKNNSKLKAFLSHFYSAILDGECIERSFELAITAANACSPMESATIAIMKKLISTDSAMDELKQSEISMMQRPKSIGNDNRFRLYIRHDADVRFVAFHDYIHNDPIDVSGLSILSSCGHLQLCHPFIGRSKHVIELYQAMQKYQIISCIGRKNYGRRTVIIKLMNYLQQHRYFKHGVIVVDCQQKRNGGFIPFEENMDHILTQQCITLRLSEHDTICQHSTSSLSPLQENKEMIVLSSKVMPSEINVSYTHDISHINVLDDMVDEFPNICMCVVILNVNIYDNDDPYHWIHQYTKKMPKTCKIIYTDDLDKSMHRDSTLPSNESMVLSPHHPYSPYFKGMKQIYNGASFTAINIRKLSKRCIAELFMNVISLNKRPQFTIDDIEDHDRLQIKFDGKGRLVKKAAAFISQLQATEKKGLSLDDICDTLPSEWIPKTIPMEMFYNSRSLSIQPSIDITDSIINDRKHSSPLLNNSTSRLQIGYSRLLRDDYIPNDHIEEVLVSKIEHATHPAQLFQFIKQHHMDGLKQLLLREYHKDDFNVHFKKKDGEESPLRIEISRVEWTQSKPKSSTHSSNSLQLTPPDTTLCTVTNHFVINDTNNEDKKGRKHSKKNKIKKGNKKKKRKKRKKETKLIQHEHSPTQSLTPKADDIDIFTPDIDNKILYKMDKALQRIWSRERCDHNECLAKISKLQKHFNNKFNSITKNTLKHNIPKLVKLDIYYLKSFGISECKELENALVIHISQFNEFWKWLNAVSYLIFKLKKIHKTSKGLLIGRTRANSLLLERENKKKGAFILYIDNKKAFQLNILYRRYNDNCLKDIVIKYDKKEDHYIIQNEQNQNMKTVKKLTDYVKYKHTLKLFYCANKGFLIRKKQYFD